MTDNIDILRKESITDIKEKIKRIQNYTHPCNKERQYDMKILGFVSGCKFNSWMLQNGIITTPAKARDKYYQNKGFTNRKDYDNACCERAGYKNSSDRHKEYMHDTGRQQPLEDNTDCPAHLGIKGENLLKIFLEDIVFEQAHKTTYKNDKGIDFNCENPKQEFIDRYPHLKLEKFKKYKIQIEFRNLLFYGDRNEFSKWKYSIEYNRRTDYFILCALDVNGDIAYTWIIYKNDKIRKGHSYTLTEEFWNRSGFTITNTDYYIEKFRKYELKKEESEKLKNIYRTLD